MITIPKKSRTKEVVGESNRKYKLQSKCDDTKYLNPSLSNIHVKQLLYRE